uniref:Peptidyl-prolyl cis-trans isomerase n=1 Tax=Ditylum brightwellii TaxID=49249 RepID=A0A6U3ZYE6_9STRA|mmetsp:Transcript_11788/g.17188  ORF Transcript_11788/g.17188 Transcript_11788/m.17188 type:complete len:183 (-) Transcript_11788:894-1442(-)
MAVTFHTSLGDLKLEVFCDTAPRTSFNFLALCASGYYDGTVFHRNMRGFMIQGGDPKGTGKGGESIWGGTFEDEFHSTNTHDRRGVVSMANKGPNTNKSQFFITYERQPHLNNVYTVFGRILDGWDVLEQMERLPVVGGTKKSVAHRPITPPVVEKVTIHANPLADEGVVYPTKDGPPETRI